MARTLRRQPFSVSTSAKDYPEARFFNQVQFKGLCDDQNEMSVDQQSFADVENVYVDENGVLTSRPPLKFYDGEAYIINQWLFGTYGLRLHRILARMHEETDEETGEIKKVATKVDNPQDYPMEELYFVFILRSITHSTVSGTLETGRVYGEVQWAIPVETLGWDFVPKVTCAQIEDKIFVWFAGIELVAFNTSGVLMSNGSRYLYFEDAVKYVYFPVHELVINGIESELETKNFLTDTYRRRYQYSALSTVNFEHLAGKDLRVGMTGDMTQNKSKHLYDITARQNQDKMMVYPYSPIGSNYHIDIAQTPRATVILRYSIATHAIEVSFDGRYFRPLPPLENIVGTPLLTRDGLWAVAFTTKGLAKCRLVAQESLDFITDEQVFTWVTDAYMRNVLVNGFPGYLDTLDTSFTPTGYFETIDQFAYIFQGPSIYSNLTMPIPYLYAEWLNGTNDVVWGHKPLISSNLTGTAHCSALLNDDIKVHFRYVAPTVDHKDLGAVVSIMTTGIQGYATNMTTSPSQTVGPGIRLEFFKQVDENINRTLRTNDVLSIREFLGDNRADPRLKFGYYVTRMNASGTQTVIDDNTIYSNDIILATPTPIDISDTPTYNENTTYEVGDYATGLANEFLFICKKRNTGHRLPDLSDNYENDYWKRLPNPIGTGAMTRKVRDEVYRKTISSEYPLAYWYVDWKFIYQCQVLGNRYRIEYTDSSFGAIRPNKRVKVSSLDIDILYTSTDLDNMFGLLDVYELKELRENENGVLVPVYETVKRSWKDVYPQGVVISKAPSSEILTGNTIIHGVGDTASPERFRYLETGIEITYKDENGDTSIYQPRGYYYPCRQMDVNALAPSIETDTMTYEFVCGYSLSSMNNSGKKKVFDCIGKFRYEYISDKLLMEDEAPIQLLLANSKWFKIMPNTDTILTDRYLFINKEVIPLPQNGELAPVVKDTERSITNKDNLILTLSTGAGTSLYEGNIHKLTTDALYLASGAIQSGDVVSYVKDAVTEADFLRESNADYGNRFIIEKLTVDSDGNLTGVVGGEIKANELVRLRAYNKTVVLPVGHPGNPTGYTDTIFPAKYPAAPAGWQVGDDWPSSFPTHPPIYANADGTIRSWAPGDVLPTGPVLLYGVTNIYKQVQPISINDTGVWYSIDGTLWTSQVSDDATLELDEYINARVVTNNANGVTTYTRMVHLNTSVPDAHAVMNEHYFSYVNKGKNLLEVTQTKRDEDKLFSEDGSSLLLYLPQRNEQLFANKITALHPLSDTEMGIFTEDDVWYIRTTVLNDGTVTYTKPIKSKIPVGLRAGSDVITALDGQALIFPTPRGLVALAPQDFIATTEKTLTYLSDAIQGKYYSFYNDGIMSAMLIPDEFELAYKPMIHIDVYKYWILLHKYLDREILAFDTRTGSWWVWTTPYPIRSIMVGSRLHVLMQIDFSAIEEHFVLAVPGRKAPLMGISFLWADREIAGLEYQDDIIPEALNGLATLVEEGPTVGARRILQYASPTINWHFTSQRLHFDQINNYKTIKGMNMTVKGNDVIGAKLSTKIFRDTHHPERTNSIEYRVNDIKTFVKPFVLMHVIDFQYKVENDVETDTPHQFKLNSLSVKYEIKERIR